MNGEYGKFTNSIEQVDHPANPYHAPEIQEIFRGSPNLLANQTGNPDLLRQGLTQAAGNFIANDGAFR